MKTKKQVLQDMEDTTREQIYSLEIMEAYLSRRIVLDNSGKSEKEMLLGRTQREIKDKKDLLRFFENYKNDIK